MVAQRSRQHVLQVCDTCGLFRVVSAVVLTLCLDPVSAQSVGISWGAVGISWVLSTITTIIVIGIAFCIRNCLKERRRKSRDVKYASERDEDGDQEHPTADEHHIIRSTTSKRPPSGLLSVSQQADYLRVNDETTRSKKRKTETEKPEPKDWVEQWCEEQAKRESVVAALQSANSALNPSSTEDDNNQTPLYPAGLELPRKDTRQQQKMKIKDKNIFLDRELPPPPPTSSHRSPPHHPNPALTQLLQHEDAKRLSHEMPPEIQDVASGSERKPPVRRSIFQASTQRPLTTTQSAVGASTSPAKELPTSSEEMQSSVGDAVAQKKESQQKTSLRKGEKFEELKSSPVRLRRHVKDNQKRISSSGGGGGAVIVKPLEFKRPPGEWPSYHLKQTARNDEISESVAGNRTADLPSKDAPRLLIVAEDRAKEEKGEGHLLSSSSSSEIDSEEETNDEVSESHQPTSKENDETATSETVHEDPSDDTPEVMIAVRLIDARQPSSSPRVESTPPSAPSSRQTSAVRRMQKQSVKQPSLLNMVPLPQEGVSPPPGLLPLTASSHHPITRSSRPTQIADEKQVRSTSEQKNEEKQQKIELTKERPQDLDLKAHRSSVGSEVVFFEPELQGTSTPALKPKAAFLRVTTPLLSRDNADNDDDDDDDDEQNSNKLSISMKKRPITFHSQIRQFHGLLSDSGLQKLVQSVYSEWRQLADILDVSSRRQTILVAGRDDDDAAKKCAYEMLKGWRDGHVGSKEELRSVLCNALISMNHPDLAEKLWQEEMVGSREQLDNRQKLVTVV